MNVYDVVGIAIIVVGIWAMRMIDKSYWHRLERQMKEQYYDD